LTPTALVHVLWDFMFPAGHKNKIGMEFPNVACWRLVDVEAKAACIAHT